MSTFEFGYTPNNLKKIRQILGLTQSELATELSMKSYRQVLRWENGDATMPHETWKKLLKYYQKTLDI